jgi:hypothetical protein
MRIRHISLAAMLAAASILASTVAAAPPAAADCISSRGDNPVVLCSQGETRKSNTTQVPITSGYVPYPCDVDWTCDNGLGIAFGND